MRSHNNKSNTKPSTERTTSRALLPLALAAVFAFATTANAAQRMGSMGSMGSARGFGGMKMTGGGRIIGNPGGNPGKQTSDGGNRTGGDDRPRRPHWKPPIIVAVPPIIAAVAPVTFGVANPGGGSSSGAPNPKGASNGVPPAGERRYVPDEVLIELASSVPTETVDALARRLRLNRVESFDSNGITMLRWKIPDRRSVPEVIRSLQGESNVLAAQPNYLYALQEQPAPNGAQKTAVTQGAALEQYALAKLRLPQAHELAKGDRVLVAVIDSGIDTTHPELAGVVAESYDALGSDEKAHAHGTAVAGAIVAHARLMGVAPEARILAARAFGVKDKTAEATTYRINKGIDWAVARGARIINMSFTGPRDPSIEQRIAQVAKQGVILIAAAGNGGPKAPAAYPAAYPNVIAVTATDADDKLFKGANRGSYIAVAAPGVDLLLPAPDAGYQVTTGTSFAAAEASGIVALMLERKPDLRYEGVRKALTATARDLGPKRLGPKSLGPKRFDTQFGAGLVDAYAALRSLEGVIATTGAKVNPAASVQ